MKNKQIRKSGESVPKGKIQGKNGGQDRILSSQEIASRLLYEIQRLYESHRLPARSYKEDVLGYTMLVTKSYNSTNNREGCAVVFMPKEKRTCTYTTVLLRVNDKDLVDNKIVDRKKIIDVLLPISEESHRDISDLIGFELVGSYEKKHIFPRFLAGFGYLATATGVSNISVIYDSELNEITGSVSVEGKKALDAINSALKELKE